MKQNVTATIIKRLEYRGENFHVNDYVRVLLKSKPDSKHACEYIAYIKEITKNTVILFAHNWPWVKVIDIKDIDKIRIAKKHENFYDNFNWDKEVICMEE